MVMIFEEFDHQPTILFEFYDSSFNWHQILLIQFQLHIQVLQII